MSEKVFEALGHAVRRQILEFLREGALEVGSIASRLPISRPAVSKHLKVLKDAGLVECRAEGTRNIFTLDVDGFESARRYLEPFWEDALESFKEAAE